MTPDAALPPAPLTSLTEDERLFRDSVYEFADREVRPLAREMDSQARFSAALLRQLFDLGVMGIEVPDEFGGAGATFFHSVLAVEALSRVDPSVGVVVDVQNTLVAYPLLTAASDDQKARYLPALCDSKVGAYALSEANSGSDAFALQTRAERKGDDWVLTGRKLWITNGAEAEVFIVFANADPAKGYKGITAFLIERDTPGFRIEREIPMLGGHRTYELAFEDCRIADAQVLGEPGSGFAHTHM